MNEPLTLGSLFAGIGGLDLGFEKAGWKTAWQVEINPFNRAVLADRFPDARRFEDVRAVGGGELSAVDCLAAGFPCQDISSAGNSRGKVRPGLSGPRSGLFFEAIRIIREIQPTWVVLENVASLLHSRGGRDFEIVLQSLAECGYLGFWRVLNAQYFGVPQSRRRVFLVAGFGRYPSLEFLADAAPVGTVSCSLGEEPEPRPEVSHPGHTLAASSATSQIGLGHEVFVAEENGWGAMVERERVSALRGLPCGLDPVHWQSRFAAGNSICPAVAQWIGEILKRS